MSSLIVLGHDLCAFQSLLCHRRSHVIQSWKSLLMRVAELSAYFKSYMTAAIYTLSTFKEGEKDGNFLLLTGRRQQKRRLPLNVQYLGVCSADNNHVLHKMGAMWVARSVWFIFGKEDSVTTSMDSTSLQSVRQLLICHSRPHRRLIHFLDIRATAAWEYEPWKLQ